MDEAEKQRRMMLALAAAGYTADTKNGWIVAPDGRKFGSIAEAYADLVAGDEMMWLRQEKTPDSAFYADDPLVEDTPPEDWGPQPE